MAAQTKTKTNKAIIDNTIKQIILLSDSLMIDPSIPTITEWAGLNRYLPAGSTERPGMWRGEFVPYTIEIQECLHPDSPVRIVSIMKSTQSVVTTTIENAMGHAIKYGLHNILYVISDLDMAKLRSRGAIDIMIDYCGLAEQIKPITIRDAQRKTADTILYKEFSGGRRFLMTSYNSIAKLKSFSWDLIIMDELIEAPLQIGDQGDPESIIEARGKTIRDLKIAKISTPSATGNCRIYRAFRSGDQREYMIPCPRCGEFQFLEFMKGSRTWGLYGNYIIDRRGKYSLEKGTERYKCRHCGKDFFEYEKESFMLCRELGGLAYWEPQGAAQDSRDRSYHVSAMMSPLTQWENIITDYLKTDMGKKLHDYRNFVITNEGWHPDTNRAYKPWEELRDRAKNYQRGTVPVGPMILTGGVDVHKNRLELQIVAWGPGMEGWSIDHQEFFGQTADRNSKAWQELAAFCRRGYAIPSLKDTELSISKIAVDVSYNPNKDPTLENELLRSEINTAVFFCNESSGFFVPVKGVDEVSGPVNLVQKKQFYLIGVSALKDEVLHNIDFKEGPMTVHFPKDYDDEYFKQFLSEIYGEEPNTGRMGYFKIYERNEKWDTYIYALAAAKIAGIDRWDDDRWDEFRAAILED
jgi:phage terminase large subunit GpA-like protein